MLFDKHDIPDLATMTADNAWAAIDAFEDYVYTVSGDEDSCSEEEYDRRIQTVINLRAEWYNRFE